MEGSMATFVLPLADTGATLETVGGKGMSLAKMAQAGLPIPDGFHVTTAAYRCFVEANGIQPCILAALAHADLADTTALESISQQIEHFFIEGNMPAEIVGAISAAYLSLCQARSGLMASQIAVAVRSSATAEDLPGASFAGQQETYLNICGGEAVLAAVKKCWASLWTARAMAYRSRQGIDPDAVALAVVGRGWVFADGAGGLCR